MTQPLVLGLNRIGLSTAGSKAAGRMWLCWALTVSSYSHALERELATASALAENRRFSAVCPNTFAAYSTAATGSIRSWIKP